MGTGTAPEEGAALAVALLDEFRARRCLVLATTHHDRLKAYASTTPGVLNASVEFDDVRLAPTYRLRVGVPGGSSGIAIARRLGLPESIVERASALIAPEAREAAGLIAYLHRSRDAVEQMQRELAEQIAAARGGTARAARRVGRAAAPAHRRTRAARCRRAGGARARREPRARSGEGPRAARPARKADAPHAWAQARSEARGEVDAAVVAHLSESQADLGVAAETLRPPALDELVPGVRVRVRGFSAPVVLRRRDDSSAEVEAGPLRMKVPLAEIIAIVAEEPAKAAAARQRRREPRRGGRARPRAPARDRAASPCTQQRRPKTPPTPTKST